MTPQYLQFVREQLIEATADLSGATKGQLLAWTENAQFDTKTYPRKKQRVRDEVTGKMITLNNPPIPGKQSRAKGSHIPLVQPVEYLTASWRRALLSLDEHYKAWLLWSYSENICWEHQETITRWAWEQFSAQISGKRIAKKTMGRLRALIWLAAQYVKGESKGGELPPVKYLAGLVGVNKTNWSQNYAEHWELMIDIYQDLDTDSLLLVSRVRSQQKSANCEPAIAKMN